MVTKILYNPDINSLKNTNYNKILKNFSKTNKIEKFENIHSSFSCTRRDNCNMIYYNTQESNISNYAKEVLHFAKYKINTKKIEHMYYS